jgi:ferredoxin
MEKPTTHNLSRRGYLNRLGMIITSTLVGTKLTALAAKKIIAIAKGKTKWLFPPSATSATMKANCIRCGLCLDACPASILKPVGERAGSRAWTPMLSGTCPTGCAACGKACPTEAIPKKS